MNEIKTSLTGHEPQYAQDEAMKIIEELVRSVQACERASIELDLILEAEEKRPSAKNASKLFKLSEKESELKEHLEGLQKQIYKIICFALAARRAHMRGIDAIEYAMYFNVSFRGPFPLFEAYSDAGKKNILPAN